jgi:hypothetical protein
LVLRWQASDGNPALQGFWQDLCKGCASFDEQAERRAGRCCFLLSLLTTTFAATADSGSRPPLP